LKAGAIAVNEGASTIEGSFALVDQKALTLASNAKLTLQAAAAAGGEASVDAAIDVVANAELVAGAGVKLAQAATLRGQGALTVAGSLALSSANNVKIGTLKVGHAGCCCYLCVVGWIDGVFLAFCTEQVLADAELKLAAVSELALESSGKAELAGKATITAAADVDKVVIKHASRTGTFSSVTINGAAAVDGGARRRSVLHEAEWTASYGETQTTFTKTHDDHAAASSAALSSLIGSLLALALML
jgi:hypothetical protein